MPAYWIAHVTVTDPERYQGYMNLAPEAFRRHGARFLARGGASETFEGPTYQRHVVIEFPDIESARACYRSPEYGAARALQDVVRRAGLVASRRGHDAVGRDESEAALAESRASATPEMEREYAEIQASLGKEGPLSQPIGFGRRTAG